MHQNRTLVRGDNLDEMRKFPDECIDLIATDPPFNSKRDYFVPYRDEHGREPDILVRAFQDTWTWGDTAEEAYRELIVDIGGQISDTIKGLRQFLDQTPMMAYLVMMAIRIVEMHRILKPTGSLYLHCDPSASHYLKIVLDAIFQPQQFRNEIVWAYKGPTNTKRWFPRKHDIILFYGKTKRAFFYPDNVRVDYTRISGTGINSITRGDRTLEEVHELEETYAERGKLVEDYWIDIPGGGHMSKHERTGYPTQKPIELYKRIIAASSDQEHLILDPFCGCGATLLAAEDLERKWIGIDLTYLATGAVKLQIEKFFPQLLNQITITGTPENIERALELTATEFEEWCVTHVLKFKSNAKKVADGGIDGTYTFPLGKIKGRQAYGKAVAQVKSGTYTIDQIRAFRTAMKNTEADLGVFVVPSPPTQGMLTEAAKDGIYKHPSYEFSCKRVKIYEIQDYFDGKLPKLPHAERVVL